MAIVLQHGMSPKQRKKILNQLKGVSLRIVSFTKEDIWSRYPELIGQVGKFISSDNYLNDVFQLPNWLKVCINGSTKEMNDFHFTSVTLEIV